MPSFAHYLIHKLSQTVQKLIRQQMPEIS